MPITLLRWKSGSAGDTLLRMLLESNSIRSQNRYLGTGTRTEIDPDFVTSFEYRQIALMSLRDYQKVDVLLLHQELADLHCRYPEQRWLLKTHCYFEFDQPVIDIVIDPELIPFVVKASLQKNPRQMNGVPDYNPIARRITDSIMLHNFDCYNFTQDIIQTRNLSRQQIMLSDILAGWDNVVTAVEAIGYHLHESCRHYYQAWLQSNQQYLPTQQFRDLLQDKSFDFDNPSLTIEEKYCLLVMARKSFKNLPHV